MLIGSQSGGAQPRKHAAQMLVLAGDPQDIEKGSPRYWASRSRRPLVAQSGQVLVSVAEGRGGVLGRRRAGLSVLHLGLVPLLFPERASWTRSLGPTCEVCVLDAEDSWLARKSRLRGALLPTTTCDPDREINRLSVISSRLAA